MIGFRPMRPTDKEAMLSICSRIWDGHDYIPYVWDDWLADLHGQFTAVLDDDKVIGISKLTLITPGPSSDWLLEGLRLDADYRGKGIGRAMHEYNVALWKQLDGQGTVRLVTHCENKTVQHLSEETGFLRVGNVSVYEASALPASEALGFELVSPAEAAALKVADGRPLPIEQIWRWAGLSAYWLNRLANERRLYRWQGDKGMLFIERVEESDPPSEEKACLFINLALSDSLPELLRDARALATAEGLPSVRVAALLDDPTLMRALAEAGYTSAWEDSLYLYALSAKS